MTDHQVGFEHIHGQGRAHGQRPLHGARLQIAHIGEECRGEAGHLAGLDSHIFYSEARIARHRVFESENRDAALDRDRHIDFPAHRPLATDSHHGSRLQCRACRKLGLQAIRATNQA